MNGSSGIFALYSKQNRQKVIAVSAAGVVLIALVDWQVGPNVSLGFLYFIPILLAAGFINRWHVVATAALCALLREVFSSGAWEGAFLARVPLVMTVFSSSGLFVGELVRNRERALAHGLELEEHIQSRQRAEIHLRMIIDSSPLAILTVDAGGQIQQANEAAHHLLAATPLSLVGEPVGAFAPDLDNVPRGSGTGQVFRTMMECAARRGDGSVFMAHVWFATYTVFGEAWLAVIILDTSEELRDREGLRFESLLRTSQILVGSLLHEVRNLSAAAAVAHSNLMRKRQLTDNKDLQALGSLVRGLESLTSSELRIGSNRNLATADLRNILNELRVVVEPSFSESLANIDWFLPENIPMVRGDHHALLQVFLNLTRNSLRAMTETQDRRLTVSMSIRDNTLAVRFQDTGTGVLAPDRLFQPFQLDSEGSGLGLYVSRAIVRSFAGDLHYEPVSGGSCFVVCLDTTTNS